MKTNITYISTGIWVLATKTNWGIKILIPVYKTKKDAEEAKEVFLEQGIKVVVKELMRMAEE